MAKSEPRTEYIVRAKSSLRAALRAKSIPEKFEAVERMNEASRKAKEAMRQALELSKVDVR